MPSKKLKRNAARCLHCNTVIESKFRHDFVSCKCGAVSCLHCNTVIESKFRHDFVSCKCGAVSVDGGLDYQRRCFTNIKLVEDLSEYE
jgi:hypothetical protein